jgi:hypothetical protein
MEILRWVLEHGIELRSADKRWTVSSASPGAGINFKSLSDALMAHLPLRPVLVTEKRNFGGDLTLLLRCNDKGTFNLCVSDLMQSKLALDMLHPVHRLTYLLGAVGYHCQRLAEVYADIAKDYCQITQITQITQIPGHGDNDVASLQNQTEPYYEFEALIGAARRTYDSARYILWPRFGPKKDSMPRSLERLLKMRTNMPEALHERLATSWQKFGVSLTNYRDCIHHYVPVEFGLASAITRRHSSQAWMTTIWIPDNPEARSKNQFTFGLHRDALTYAWELADEVLGVSTAVVEAAVPRKAGD